MNRWKLTDEIRNRIKPRLEEWLKSVESFTAEQLENMDLGKELSIDLSDQGINPSQLEALFKELGYEVTDRDRNGWEMDFWIYMFKEDGKHFASGCEKIVITGCGMTFELCVCVDDDYI